MRIFAFILLLASYASFGQQLMSPEEFLGYPLGDRFTRHHQIVEYYQHVAEVMPNVKLVQYGETNEHRPLITAIISSQQNFNNLETIRTDNLKRAGLMEGNPADNKIAIVWLSYNVHGDESSSSEATMKTLHALAEASNANIQQWLQNTVVILDPCINPDGRDRYANYFNQYGSRVPNPDLNAMEHRQPWPGGRTNHYLFDLNRDWAWLSQVESQARIAWYNQWMPQVHVDFHEQGINSPYYFPPAAEPFHEIITPWQREFQQLIGKNHAKYFDQEGWLYFTRESFDLFYPSYGDTYPTFNGSIGMTYEKAGGGRAGLAGQMANGDTITLHDRLLHHHTTGISTVEASSVNADRLVDEFANYFKEGATSPSSTYKTYVIKGTNSTSKLKALTTWLDAHQIEYGSGRSSKRLSGYNYMTRANQSVTIEPTDMLVSAYQPKSRFVTAVFEPQSKLVDSVTYDITAWAVPYMYGVEAYAMTDKVEVTDPFQVAEQGQIITNTKPYAYIGRYESLEDVRWLAFLLKNNIRVRTSERAFTINNESYDKGTLVVLRWDNEFVQNFDAIMQEASEKFEKETDASPSGLVDAGQDFGSGHYTLIEAPRVALLGGEQTSSYDFGQAWYFFEQELNYQVSVIGTDLFPRVDLEEYDVLVVPGGSYRLFNEERRKSLRSWVQDGGRLVLIQNAIRSFANTDQFGIVSKKNDDEDEEDDNLIKYEEQERDRVSSRIPGAIYRVRMDPSHPLAFGYGESYASLKVSSSRYEYLEDGWNVGVIESSNDVLSGFVGAKLKPKLAKTLVFGVEDMGSGSVVYMVDNPLYRAFWYNGKMIFGNAVFIR